MRKKLVIAAAICIAAGLVISVGALAGIGFDLSKLNTSDAAEKNYPVEEDFENISVESLDCDVRFEPSEDGKCRVVCTEEEKVTHAVTVENNTLTVKRADERKWYECIQIGFYVEGPQIVVYLPESEYESLCVKGTGGDIRVPEDFAFADVQIESTSGEISFSSPVKNRLDIETSSGDIYVKKMTAGDASLRATSGEISISSVKIDGKLEVRTKGGDVSLLESDAGSIRIDTTSGEVYGRLLSEKIFTIDTKKGDVDVPDSVSGGKCEIRTSSGDIQMSVAAD